MARLDWERVLERSQAVLDLAPENLDAQQFFAAAERNLSRGGRVSGEETVPTLEPRSTIATGVTEQPTSFANGRYQVKRFLGEGGKKRVYLAQDTTLDREVAFALIKTEGLDDTSRARIQREAQARGRLGFHAHIVSVIDLGQESDQPYMVTELMGGGMWRD